MPESCLQFKLDLFIHDVGKRLKFQFYEMVQRQCKMYHHIYQTLRTLRTLLGTYIFCRLALKLDLLNVSGVNWIGLYTKYLTERAQRKAFLETRRSLEMRFKTQKENERQERLLLSVLPSFVAQQMIRDIGSLRI